MEFESLLAFTAIVNEGSFSKAAEVLHLTQPAVSKRIQNLEAKLGATLFERLQRDIILTDAGKALLPHALNILHNLDNAKQAIHEVDGKIQGTLRIVASHHIGLHRLPIILREYSSKFPEVDLQLNFLDSESAYALLKENIADLAFITIPDEIRDEFQCHLVWNDPMSFVCGPDHPLVKLKTVKPKDLAKHNAILPSQTTLTYRVVEKVFNEHKLPLNAKFPTNYLETMKMMAGVGMGWSVLPNTMIDDELKTLPVEKPFISRRLGAISYTKKHTSRSARCFLACAAGVWGSMNQP